MCSLTFSPILNDYIWGDTCISKAPIAVIPQDFNKRAKDVQENHFHEYNTSALHLESSFHLHLWKTFENIIGRFIHWTKLLENCLSTNTLKVHKYSKRERPVNSWLKCQEYSKAFWTSIYQNTTEQTMTTT